jgi:hypothetical protein
MDTDLPPPATGAATSCGTACNVFKFVYIPYDHCQAMEVWSLVTQGPWG